MRNFHFDRLTKEQEMDPAVKEYDIPKDSKTLNCVHVRNGRLKFGFSRNLRFSSYRPKSGGQVWLIPPNGGGAKKIRLPDLKRTSGGWHYGRLELVF